MTGVTASATNLLVGGPAGSNEFSLIIMAINAITGNHLDVATLGPTY
jgi:hypothetical protein